eukprot:1531618-Amphidinium_carterae.1
MIFDFPHYDPYHALEALLSSCFVRDDARISLITTPHDKSGRISVLCWAVRYRAPETPTQLLTHYFVARELYIAHSLLTAQCQDQCRNSQQTKMHSVPQNNPKPELVHTL